MIKEDRDLIVMKKVAPKIVPKKLMMYQRLFTSTVKEITTMKKFKRFNKNRRFAIQVELFTKAFLASEATEEDQNKFSNDLKELILVKVDKDNNKRRY